MIDGRNRRFGVPQQPEGYKHSFKIFGTILLVIEMRLKVGNITERLKAIARVIAECDGKPCASLVLNFLLLTPDVQAVTSLTWVMVFFHLSTVF